MKCKFVKLLSVLLCIFILSTSVFTIYAYAGIKSDTAEIDLLQEGDFVIPEESKQYYSSGLFADFSEYNTVEEAIYLSLLACDSQIYIADYRVPVSEFVTLYTNIINNHPDLFYVTSSIRYSYTGNNYIYIVYPYYALSENEIDDAKVIFNEGVEKAISNIDDSMNDLQKALVLHDYICDLATYADLSAGDYDIYHSAYGFFYDGNIVCAGYALIYSYLMNLCGIECRYVVSNPMQHAWNAVKIGDCWYNVDLTYDDICVYNGRANTRGAMQHRCFMVSDSLLYSELGYYHFGGETLNYIQTTDTTYDEYFWNDIDTNILVINGCYYYLSPSSQQYLYKRDLNGNETQVGTAVFPSVSVTLRGSYSDEENVAHVVSHKDYYNRLAYLDNRFYINSSKALYSYCLYNGNYRKIVILNNIDANVIGLGVNDDQLVYQTNSSAEQIVLDKLSYWNNNVSKARNVGYNNYVDINLDGYVNGKDYYYITKQKKTQ